MTECKKHSVIMHGDHIDGLSLRMKLWMWWNGVSEEEIVDRYWEQWNENFRKLIEALGTRSHTNMRDKP